MIKTVLIFIFLLNVIKAKSETNWNLPENLTVFNITNVTAEVKLPQSTGININNIFIILKIQNTNDVAFNEHIIEPTVTDYTFKNLIPGGNYKIEICVRDKKKNKTLFCHDSPRYFATVPNPPGNFNSITTTEKTITINWLPSFGLSQCYRVEIENSDEKFSKKIDKTTMTFVNLFPGRAYNISVKSDSGYRVSTPIKVECRTRPLPPASVIVNQSSIAPTSLRVVWSAPSEQTDFDGYKVWLHHQPPGTLVDVDPVVVSKDVHSWEFKNLVPSEFGYQVNVETVSGNVSSHPAHCSSVPSIK
ncbi:hypothetical protein HCN44_007634 [Aphidius gifuensis]|uniref:Fibronectin type-III domain-containing protein n=1 Tax=Aphidius gifuensis TaxID=684658 RepID=A0A834XJN9_APHGI|nr:tyrosine-protein phosphatase 10D-like [Aphidius gifuensis]KAF7988140.1 hypothetical protein HCN44_007634 [Aphidius gifuensis]